MQPELSGEAWPGDAWAFGGVSIQVQSNVPPLSLLNGRFFDENDLILPAVLASGASSS